MTEKEALKKARDTFTLLYEASTNYLDKKIIADAVQAIDEAKTASDRPSPAWRDLTADECRRIFRDWQHHEENALGLFQRFKEAAAPDRSSVEKPKESRIKFTRYAALSEALRQVNEEFAALQRKFEEDRQAALDHPSKDDK
jgi:hypothetical protein